MSETQTHHELPGLTDAIAQLRRAPSARADIDDLYADVLDDPMPEAPDSAALSGSTAR